MIPELRPKAQPPDERTGDALDSQERGWNTQQARHHLTLCPAPPPNQWQNSVNPILCHQTWTPEHPPRTTLAPRHEP